MTEQQFQSLGCIRLFTIVFGRKDETTEDTGKHGGSHVQCAHARGAHDADTIERGSKHHELVLLGGIKSTVNKTGCHE